MFVVYRLNSAFRFDCKPREYKRNRCDCRAFTRVFSFPTEQPVNSLRTKRKQWINIRVVRSIKVTIFGDDAVSYEIVPRVRPHVHLNSRRSPQKHTSVNRCIEFQSSVFRYNYHPNHRISRKSVVFFVAVDIFNSDFVQ